MMRTFYWLCALGGVSLLSAGSPSLGLADDGADKLRVLVDKVMSWDSGGVDRSHTYEEAIQESAEAGFNVFLTREYGDNAEKLREIAEATERHGIETMGWLRGTLRDEDAPQKIWPNGQADRDIVSPNADEFWDWWTEHILGMAEISRDTALGDPEKARPR